MNDRFKFRVWSNKYNRYIVDSHYPIGSDHIIVIRQDGKAYNLGLGDYEDYSNMHSWAVMEEFTDCIFERCTGLKDKNGNLIYEGNILLLRNNKFEVGHNNITVFFKCLTDKYTHIDPMDFDYDESEIIDNIHEQAEQKYNK